MTLLFQPADTADIDVIFEQAKRLIDTYEDVASINYDQVLVWVRRKIAENISQYRSVTADGTRCAWYRLCDDGELDDLYVLPSFQNRGIGTEIMKKCIAESENNLYLYVFSRNVRAIAFYERFGFSVCEVVGNTRLIMALNG